MPDLAEVGGVYHAYQDANGNWQKGPGATFTAQQLASRYNFDVSKLAPEGPWDGGRGFETTAQALARAQHVADWLQTQSLIKSQSLEGQVPECIVIVSHADFLALLLAALNKMDAQGASENPDYDVSVHGIPDVPDVSVHGATEQGLHAGIAGGIGPKDISMHSIQGGTPYRLRHNSSAAEVSQADIDDAANVYKRYRISLACTTLLQVKPNGQVKTLWMNQRDHLDVQGGCTACAVS